ncbi:hypothetical protein [Neokomagataea tanensis]|uniref:hypothetical protein n=1 Tax=Neokomagataea TaxID=1223423 RepID=UPI001143F81F|nr:MULTISPECIES: hypothetical protein [Neokomagataea]
MSEELFPGFTDLLQGWVLKKGPARAPQRVAESDVEDLAKASIDTLRQRVTGEAGADWGSLQALTDGWLVQRQKGEKPSPLGEEDFRFLVTFVLEGLSAPRQKAIQLSPLEEVEQESAVTSGDESQIAQEDPFKFAREHLARAL